MSQIDRQRIVGKSEDELDELSCGICHDIFDEPVVTQCCRQTYCKLCINEWLNTNKSCPNDRQDLDVNGLIPAARMVVNIINKLNIKCENYLEGCPTVLAVEDMKNHLEICDKNQCLSCKKKNVLVQQMENRLKNIECTNKQLERENEIFQKERTKFEEQIKQLNEQLRQLNLAQEEELTLARTYSHNIKKISQMFDESIIPTFISYCRDGINQCNDFKELANFITNKLIEKSGRIWTLIVYISSSPVVILNSFNHQFIEVNFGRLTIEAFQRSDETQTEPYFWRGSHRHRRGPHGFDRNLSREQLANLGRGAEFFSKLSDRFKEHRK